MRRFIAARVAAGLAGPDTRVEMRRGRLGELRVTVDGREAFAGSRILWTAPGRAVRTVRAWLAGHAGE